MLNHHALKGEQQHNALVKQAQKWVGQTFYGTLLKQMHNSPFKAKMFDGGRGGQAFQPMMDQHLIDHMSRNTAKGLVASIVKKIERKNGIHPEDKDTDQQSIAVKSPDFKQSPIENPGSAYEVPDVRPEDIINTAMATLTGHSHVSPLIAGVSKQHIAAKTAEAARPHIGARTGLTPTSNRPADYRAGAYQPAAISRKNENQGSEKNPHSNVRFHVPTGLRA